MNGEAFGIFNLFLVFFFFEKKNIVDKNLSRMGGETKFKHQFFFFFFCHFVTLCIFTAQRVSFV